MPNNIITKFFLFIGITIVLPLVFWFIFFNSERKTQKQVGSLSLATEKFIAEIKKHYENGDYEGVWKNRTELCSDIPFNHQNVHPNFLKCNIVFLKCLLKNEITSMDSIYRQGDFYFSPIIESLKAMKKGGVLLRVFEQNSSSEFSLKLENTCRSVRLPENFYVSVYNGEDYWDNFGQDIFVDKNYITEWDISHKYNGKLFFTKKDELKPSLSLSTAEKNKFCEKEGGQLLPAHIFEAASFYPLDGKPISEDIPRFHWGKPKKGEMELNKVFCEKNYVKGCEDHLPYILHNDYGASWIGIYGTLGSEIEEFKNTFGEDKVYKLSSRYFRRDSRWHDVRLKTNELPSFPRKRNENIENTGAAFRCMFSK